MERSVALKKLEKLLGKKMGWRINTKAPTPEEREVAKDALPAAIENRNDLRRQRDARYQEILASDPEYQRLKAESLAAGNNVDKLQSVTRCQKITVGTSEGMFFMVRAEGDSWEEIFEKLASKA